MVHRNPTEKVSVLPVRSGQLATSAALRTAGHITSVPQPDEILNELSKCHVLIPTHGREISFRFQHQQYQEFFAAGALKMRLLELVQGKDPSKERTIQK
jgi:hypothetical protein